VLHDSLIPARGLDGDPALMNVVTAGLLDVDVLPRLSGPDRHERVPVIGRGDRDHIDVLVVKNPANVLHSGRCAAAVGLDLMDAIVKGPGVGIDQISDDHRGHLHVLIDMRPARPLSPAIATRIVSFAPMTRLVDRVPPMANPAPAMATDRFRNWRRLRLLFDMALVHSLVTRIL